MKRYYAGIGSRETPQSILEIMTASAVQFAAEGYILRSGAAPGADSAFEAGAGDQKEIWLPWLGFNGSKSQLLPHKHAFEVAAHFHPAWDRCSPAARKLHARNVHQILGYDLNTKSEFVMCWTKDGKASGGTGQAIRIAEGYGIPVYYL